MLEQIWHRAEFNREGEKIISQGATPLAEFDRQFMHELLDELIDEAIHKGDDRWFFILKPWSD